MTEQEIASQDLTKLSPQQIYTMLAALVTLAVGQIVAFVPQLSNQQQNLISAGTFLVTIGILIAGAIHHHAQVAAAQKRTVAVGATPQTQADKLRAQLVAAGHTPEA